MSHNLNCSSPNMWTVVNAALKAQVKELKLKRDSFVEEYDALNGERQRLLSILKDADTFRKFKALQKEQANRRAELAYIEGQLARVDAVESIEQQLRDLRSKRDEYITAIELSLQRGSPIKTAVTQLFNRYVKQVLNINGEFIVTKNKVGNLEFDIKTKDALGGDTSQDRGHSYHMLLCALFDLSVLKALEKLPFYHFVYHDGIFEGLDNRVKLRLLDLIRSVISDGGTQYILSVIDSDLPRDPSTEKAIPFADEEIVVTLHDQGNEGRLFKMASF